MNFDALLAEYGQALAWVDAPVNPVHLLGAGGVGMAGLALLLHARGFSVSGCDLNDHGLTDSLRARGMCVAVGHDPAHAAVPPITWAVRSAAVPADHPETLAFRAKSVPVFRRGVVLPALMRKRRAIAVAGTHGKTTTTGFLAQILAQSGLPHGFCIGGEINALGAVAALTDDPSALIAIEADESDGTLALYEAETAVVTNIDFDHQENFADTAAFEACFLRFIERTRGCLIYGSDDPAAVRLIGGRPGAVSFGVESEADYRATILEQQPGWVRFQVAIREKNVGEVRLPASGAHNVRNALAALAAAAENGIPVDGILKTLSTVERPRRRFENLITCRGRRIISDYAHHPTEIRALLQSALNENPSRMLTVFQPHRYSRTRTLGDAFPGAFEGADPLVLLPVYAASEAPVDGGDSFDLYARFSVQSKSRVWLAENLAQVEEWLAARTRRGDLVLIAGAGSVEQIGLNLTSRWQADPPPEPDAATSLRASLLKAVGIADAKVTGHWPLAARTTLGVGGSADVGVKATELEELAALLVWAGSVGVPVRILGAGSNILVSDLGVRGIVIRLAGPQFTTRDLLDNGQIHAGAALPLARLAALSRSGKVAGFGFLNGIPGTVGGAICMNAGASGQAIGDRVATLYGFDAAGRPWRRERHELKFSYRACLSINPGDVVTAVRLQPPDHPDPAEPRMIEASIRRRAWMRGKRSAGSVFRNPGHDSPAGVLLETAGCKGLRIGGACVCNEHANVIACESSARGSDVLALMQTMQTRVQRQTGVLLMPEIVRWI